MALRVLALDLERTLISDANRADPRPGLAEFLAFCAERFARIVLFTTVEESDARAVIDELVRRDFASDEFAARLEYVSWWRVQGSGVRARRGAGRGAVDR